MDGVLGIPGVRAYFALHGANVGLGPITLVNASLGLPPVVVGLMLYLLLSRSGMLGGMRMLFTPAAMALAQFLLALPIVAALSTAPWGT